MANFRQILNANSIKQICELYKNGESMCTLSKRFGVANTTIWYHLKKNGIPVRSKSESLKLGFKLGRVKIRKHEIPKSSIKITPQKSYLLGVLCGDGYIDFSDRRGTFQVGLQTIDKEFALKFGRALEYVYKITPSFSSIVPKNENWSKKYQIRICSKNTCLDILNYNSFKTENWRVPVEIKKSNKICKSQFLKGFFDSEGYVDKKSRRIGVTSINHLGLQKIRNMLLEFKIRSSIKEHKVYGNRRFLFVLDIHDRKSIEIFYRKIGFTIDRKQKALKNILKSYKFYKTLREKITELKPQIVELRSKGYSYDYIAKKLNLSIATVWRYSVQHEKLAQKGSL